MISLRILVIKLFILKSHALHDKLILERSDFNSIENTVYSELNQYNFNDKRYKNTSDIQSESLKHLGNQILYNNKFVLIKLLNKNEISYLSHRIIDNIPRI